MMFHIKNPTIARVIINKNNKVLTKAQVCYAHMVEEERNKQNRRSEGGDSLEVTWKGAYMEFDFGW